MTSPLVYALAGAVLFLAGLYGLVARAHLFWKILALNVMGSGTFLILIGASPRLPGGAADPIPQAMVLTGIVVATGATAVALGIALRVAVRTGRPCLPEEARRELSGAAEERSPTRGAEEPRT